MIDRLAPPPLPERLIVLMDAYRRIEPFDFSDPELRWIGLLWMQTALSFAQAAIESDISDERMDVLVSAVDDVLMRLEPYRQTMIDEASDAGY